MIDIIINDITKIKAIVNVLNTSILRRKEMIWYIDYVIH